MRITTAVSLVATVLLVGCSAETTAVTVGSKKFTESVVLGEILAAVAEVNGKKTAHRRELGGTRVLFNALQAGDIDAYVEYTGTIAAELLPGASVPASDLDGLKRELLAQGIVALDPLGFNNTYALALKRSRAAELKLTKTSDLVAHPDLAMAFSNEFMEREDGWPALATAYRLPQTDIRGMDHDLAYRAVDDGSRDVMEAYTTDAQIAALDFALLADDRAHFPAYRALILLRKEFVASQPSVVDAWKTLSGRIDTPAMAAMNKSAQLDREPESQVARRFLTTTMKMKAVPKATARAGFWTHTKDHLVLVGISMLLALLVALPLGAGAAKVHWLRTPVLGVVSVLQTVPSLALLVFLIPFLGVGAAPAIVALFVYSLLPVVRNTVAGLDGIAPDLHESARALGLPAQTRLWKIELPLALPSILAGIKTAAVINVGTATLGAIIGAGGYGQPILTGIRLGSTPLILQGAIPAACLALLVSGMFDLIERLVVSKGLQHRPVR